eukprot:TRINITY_DN7637_c0_g1_i2.p1 TRINITY_DN7637_c0_g1~~TRINITY_DN7637_c0_g1_i2.p1  ORF type:complete len:111 (+),score=26.34 TRINITY_DN7637_c0_g1_i2:193-525(+)
MHISALRWALLLLSALLFTEVASMPVDLSLESNPHVIDGSHDFARLVDWVSASVRESESQEKTHGSDSKDDLGEAASDRAKIAFAQQAKLLREGLQSGQTQKHQKQQQAP